MSEATGCVSVPAIELERLEQARKNIYKHLGDHVNDIALHHLTEQMWKVANTIKWDKCK